MLDHHTLAEVYRMQHRLIDMSGGMPGVRDKGAVEAGVFVRKSATTARSKKRPPRCWSRSPTTAASSTATSAGLMERHEFRFGKILDWIRQRTKARDLRD